MAADATRNRCGAAMRLAAILLVLISLEMAGAGAARAQGRYRPQSPTISPWLNLQQKNAGPLGGYLSNVRPEQQLRDTLQQHQSSIQSNTGGLLTLQGQVRQSEKKESVRPTGTGSTFMNYSHFYPGYGTGPAAAATARRPPRTPPPPSRGGMGGMGGMGRAGF